MSAFAFGPRKGDLADQPMHRAAARVGGMQVTAENVGALQILDSRS